MPPDAASVLIGALAALWRRIQAFHPEIPSVVLLPAPGPRNVLGHFAPLRWQAKGDATLVLHEVVVVAEHLARDAADIAETVLHEAAHALNFARGIKDCSTTSQYHNQHFREAATELGLLVQKVPNYGWALTSLPAPTQARYEGEIAALEAALVHRRETTASRSPPGDEDGDGDEAPPPKPKSRMLKASCPCGFIIRAARATFDATTILCSSCRDRFTTED